MTKLTGIFSINIINNNYIEIKKSVNSHNEYILVNRNFISTVNGIYIEKSFIESHKDFFRKINSI
jgi:hypothetical protein